MSTSVSAVRGKEWLKFTIPERERIVFQEFSQLPKSTLNSLSLIMKHINYGYHEYL